MKAAGKASNPLMSIDAAPGAVRAVPEDWWGAWNKGNAELDQKRLRQLAPGFFSNYDPAASWLGSILWRRNPDGTMTFDCSGTSADYAAVQRAVRRVPATGDAGIVWLTLEDVGSLSAEDAEPLVRENAASGLSAISVPPPGSTYRTTVDDVWLDAEVRRDPSILVGEGEMGFLSRDISASDLITTDRGLQLCLPACMRVRRGAAQLAKQYPVAKEWRQHTFPNGTTILVPDGRFIYYVQRLDEGYWHHWIMLRDDGTVAGVPDDGARYRVGQDNNEAWLRRITDLARASADNLMKQLSDAVKAADIPASDTVTPPPPSPVDIVIDHLTHDRVGPMDRGRLDKALGGANARGASEKTKGFGHIVGRVPSGMTTLTGRDG